MLGPPRPPLTMNAGVNAWKAWIVSSTRLNRMIGESIGSVTDRNVRQVPEPSTAAAS
ncbi:hypothetical protein GCM10027615_36410 [Plantactinospora veratri]